LNTPVEPDLLQSKLARAWIDLFRAVAIAQVVVFHVLFAVARFAPKEAIPGFIDRLPGALNVFWEPVGVDAIFVVSAFLLTRGLLANASTGFPANLRVYAIKRLSRILPLYYVALAFYALVEGPSWQSIILSAFFLGHTLSDTNVIPVGWSMEVMVLVYLALPFVVFWLARSRRPLLWLTVLLLISVAVRFLAIAMDDTDLTLFFARIVAIGDIPTITSELYYRPWHRLSPFVIGVALGFLCMPGSRAYLAMKRSRLSRNVLVMTGLAVLIALNWLPIQRTEASWNLTRYDWVATWYLGGAYAVSSLAVAMILAGLVTTQDGQARFAEMKVFGLLSRNIFAIYLFHFPCILVAAIIVFATARRAELEIAFGQANVGQIVAISVVALAISLTIAIPITKYLEVAPQNWLRRRFMSEQNP